MYAAVEVLLSANKSCRYYREPHGKELPPAGDNAAQPERPILRMSIAPDPEPEPTSPVIAPAAEPTKRAFARSGQTSRPVMVFANGARTLRRQSGQSRPDNPTAQPTLLFG